MKAYNKRRATIAQRQMITDAVIAEYEKIKKKHEEKIGNRMFFVFTLALASVADEQLGFGDTRRDRLIEAVVKEANELSEKLLNNKFVDEHGTESFDSDYNRDWLGRLAKQYHLKFDESVFDDDFEEVADNAGEQSK